MRRHMITDRRPKPERIVPTTSNFALVTATPLQRAVIYAISRDPAPISVQYCPPTWVSVVTCLIYSVQLSRLSRIKRRLLYYISYTTTVTADVRDSRLNWTH